MAVSVVDNVAGNRPKRFHQRSEGQERQSDIFKQTVSPSERYTRCCAGPERQLSRPGLLSTKCGAGAPVIGQFCVNLTKHHGVLNCITVRPTKRSFWMS